MGTVCLGVRIPKDLLEDVEKARQITGAVSYSDLLRDALIAYLRGLSLISDRSTRIKGKKEIGDPNG
jgi:metal-responsive CopG/Arc/MetJ family transcriptional regulator